jgi:hypothetical protein
MTQYRTYLDDSTSGGQGTILSIQQNGSEFGVGISTDIICNNISAGIVTVTNLRVSGIATVGLGTTSDLTTNSTLSFELTSNTNLRIRVRGTDGVIRSANLTLS